MLDCIVTMSGKMMANMLRMTEPGQFTLVNFQAGKQESPDENKALMINLQMLKHDLYCPGIGGGVSELYV